VRTYEKGIVPSDLCESKSKDKLKEQVEAIKVEFLNNFKFAFTQYF